MKARRLLLAGLLAGIAGLAPGAAAAAELVTPDGTRITLQAVSMPAGMDLDQGLQPAAVRAGVAWTVLEPTGIEYQGVLAGSGSVRDELPVLIQNPVDGEVHLIFTAMKDSTKDLFLRTWLGQSWGDPVWLAGTENGDDLLPRVTFTPTGEIVFAWIQERPDGTRHVLFQYGVLDASGMLVRHANVDMGRPEIYTLPVDGDVQLESGVAHLATDATGERAVLALADPDTDDIGWMRLDLRALRQIGGGGSFAPVPVNFLQVAMGNGPPTLGDRIAATGEILPAWRVEVLGGEGYYWFDEETMSGIGFRAGNACGLVTVARPDDELVAHSTMVALLRASLGRLQSELEPLLTRQEATRNRRGR